MRIEPTFVCERRGMVLGPGRVMVVRYAGLKISLKVGMKAKQIMVKRQKKYQKPIGLAGDLNNVKIIWWNTDIQPI